MYRKPVDTVAAIVLKRTNAGYPMLLVYCHTNAVGDQELNLTVPDGTMNPDELPARACRRIFAEKFGIELAPESIHPIEHTIWTYKNNRGEKRRYRWVWAEFPPDERIETLAEAVTSASWCRTQKELECAFEHMHQHKRDMVLKILGLLAITMPGQFAWCGQVVVNYRQTIAAEGAGP